MERDSSLDSLLDLDGQILVLDKETRHWVRFIVQPVPASVEGPHGLNYSLTLRGEDGERLAGFDNAHPVRSKRTKRAFDHKHRLKTVRPYEYQDAATLLTDFWAG
jgi:Family of unknown function (DUF6516)